VGQKATFYEFVTPVHDDIERQSINKIVQFLSGVRLVCCGLSVHADQLSTYSENWYLRNDDGVIFGNVLL